VPKSFKLDMQVQFLTRKQIAPAFKVPPRTVDRWIATGQLLPIRLSLGFGRGGQRLFYSAADVKKLARAETHPAAPRRRTPRAPKRLA